MYGIWRVASQNSVEYVQADMEVCGSWNMRADRQTDWQTERYAHHSTSRRSRGRRNDLQLAGD